MKKSKLILGLFLIASLGASAGENAFIDGMENAFYKRGEAQANYNETYKKFSEIQDNIFNKNAEFKQEFSNLDDIKKNLWDYNPEYFKNLDKKIENLKTKNAGNAENLKQLKEIENYISFTKNATLKLADANFNSNSQYDNIWDAPLNNDLDDKIGLQHKKSFNRIFKKVKQRTELIEKYENILKTATDKDEISLVKALLKDREYSLNRWKKNIKEIAKASGDNITFEDFEKAVKDPAEKEKLKKRIENGKVGEYFKKENDKYDELKFIATDTWGEYVEDSNGQVIEFPTENDKKQNTGILENRLYGIQLEKNLNAEIEKNKTEHKKITDDISANKKEISKKVNADDVFNKTETNNLLSNKADKTDLTKINNDIKNNTDKITENKKLIDKKANADDVFNKTETNNLLNKKADKTELTGINNKIKNNTDNIAENKKLIDKKANVDDVFNKTETNNLLNKKADKTELTKINNDIKNNTDKITENKKLIDKKANANDVFTKTQTNDLLNKKADKTELTGINSKIKNNLGSITSNTNNIKTNTTNIADNSKKIEKNTNSISNVDKIVKNNITLIENANKKIIANEKNISSNSKIITENKKAIADEITNRKNDVKSINEKVNNNLNKINANEKTLKDTNIKVEENKNKISGLDKEIKNNKNLINETEKKVEKNTKNISNITNKITEIEKIKKLGDIKLINNSIEKNRNDIAENKKAIKSLDKKASSGIAAVATMSMVDMVHGKAGDVNIGAGVGGFDGTQAVAVGVAYAPSDNFNVAVKMALNPGKAKYTTYGAGFNYNFNINK